MFTQAFTHTTYINIHTHHTTPQTHSHTYTLTLKHTQGQEKTGKMTHNYIIQYNLFFFFCNIILRSFLSVCVCICVCVHECVSVNTAFVFISLCVKGWIILIKQLTFFNVLFSV